METTLRYFLKKDDRLKSRKAIEMMFTKGKSFSNFPFRILWLVLEDEEGLKAGFSASTKNFKKATDRNRIKRLMKEAYRLQKNELVNKLSSANRALHLFFIYTGKDLPAYELLYAKTGAILKKITKLVDEDIK